jgi:putative SOS response-associated peptidase YedK
MCGRFTLMHPWSEVVRLLRAEAPEPPPARRWNVAPTQPVAVLVLTNERRPQLRMVRWGLIPSWAKDPAVGNRMINARAETLAEKPSFRDALVHRRCLVVADGFYEWRGEKGRKVPVWIHPKDGGLLTFAGLWESWKAPDGSEVRSCAIVTCPSNDLIATFHDRMPVIVPPEARERWLDPGPAPAGSLDDLLVPFPSDGLALRDASPRVNSPANEGEELGE